MFSFLKKNKPLLKDLIPNDFTDIHSHVLWGLDDGAKTELDTKSLFEQMKALGFGRIITTPHIMSHVWENTTEGIALKENEVRKAQLGWNLSIPFKAAGEYLLDGNFRTKLENETLLPLKDNLVLVELSYSNPPIQLYEILYDIQIKGYKPLLAHPERYLYYANAFSTFKQLKKAGCLFQLNLLSTTGYYGKDVLQLAEKFLQQGLIDFVGSDIHNQNHINGFHHQVLLKNSEPLQQAIGNNAFFYWD